MKPKEAMKASANALMDKVRRERETEEWVRSVDPSDIVERLHFMEDETDAKDEEIAELKSENRRLKKLLIAALGRKHALDCGCMMEKEGGHKGDGSCSCGLDEALTVYGSGA